MNEPPLSPSSPKLLNQDDRNQGASQSSSALGILSPTANNGKFRSRTPEPDKVEAFFRKNKDKKEYISKSDGNSTDSSPINSDANINGPQIIVNTNNNNNNNISLHQFRRDHNRDMVCLLIMDSMDKDSKHQQFEDMHIQIINEIYEIK